MSEKLKVGILGATGMVGQRFITLLENHPWFEVVTLAASAHSAGKTYAEAVGDRWKMETPMPEYVKNMVVVDGDDAESVASGVDFMFSAVNMPKDQIRAIEERYAKTETPVVSNNSAHRWTPDVPMVIPEINPEHFAVIPFQRKRLGTTRGFVAVKPNCSIQSYVPALTPLLDFEPEKVSVCTYQAISGAGKTFKRWPEMVDNVIPYIGGEEEKSEQEPLKIWGHLENGVIVPAKAPIISAHCVRVAVADGHLATCWASFEKPATKEEIIERWRTFEGLPQKMNLPSAPHPFLQYFEEDNRPQTRLDRDFERGMGISLGRLRGDSLFDWRFVGLSHNTLRGAAGGGKLLLTASPNHPRIHLTNEPAENPAQPPMFCMLLRKHLTGGRLVSMQQPEMERLLDLTFDCTDEMGFPVQKTLVAELMGRTCNLYLLSPEGRILDCLRRIGLDESAKRAALPGLMYQPPEPVDDIVERIQTLEREIADSLNTLFYKEG